MRTGVCEAELWSVNMRRTIARNQFQLPVLYWLTWNLKLSIKHCQGLPILAVGNMASIHTSVKNKVLETTGHMGPGSDEIKTLLQQGFLLLCCPSAKLTYYQYNIFIWQVIVQNYNSILTLSHLYRSSDALLVHENDAVHKICAKLMNIKQISFRDINQVLAHQLGIDLMEDLVPHPEFKMLGVRNIPQMSENSLAYSTFTWAGLLKHLRQMLISNAKMEEGIDWQVRPPLSGLPTLGKMPLSKELHFNTSIANLVILRGKDVHSADLGAFKDPALYTSWLEPVTAFNVWKTQRAFSKYEKSAALVSNSQSLVKPLDMIVGKAWNMFASKAYLHQYTKFGIEEEDFLDGFALLEQVIASYSNL
ncbi:tubulin delta chain [Camelus ferus]|nr:tubulin delta chain [Camelus ferus]